MPTIIPFPVYYNSNSGPISEEDVKIFIAGLLFFSTLFIISSVFKVVTWYRNRTDWQREHSDYTDYIDHYFDFGIAGLFNSIMVITYACILITYILIQIAKYL